MKQEGCLARVNTTSPLPCNITGAQRQRNMAQRKEQIKTPEKELSDEEIANLSDAQFKTLVIRMLTEMSELGCKTMEEIKAVESKIKESIPGINSEVKQTGNQINNLKQKEEIKL